MPKIGSSDLDVFPLNLGGNTFGWTSDETTSRAVLDAYAAGGGNFIDTADSYMASAPGNSGGESETILGQWMADRGNRASVVVATKVSQHPQFKGLAASNIAAAADASLARLQSDYIDLYYAHFDDEATPIDEVAGAFDALVTAGKVRNVGVSNVSPARIRAWMESAKTNGFAAPVALQPNYNLVHRQPFERELVPIAAEFDLGVMPYFSLASGFLTGKYRTRQDLEGVTRGTSAGRYFSDQGLAVIDVLGGIAQTHGSSIATTALAWLLSRPSVTAAIASARVPEQLADLMAAAELTLTEEELARLDTASAGIPD
jgi:aryl-alcohol dehydrogenase-like predicted oxidoreductase